MYVEEDWERCFQLCDFTGTETKEEMVHTVLDKAVELMGLKLSTVKDTQISMERLDRVLDESSDGFSL